MTIREIQKKVADALNGVEALVQDGCKISIRLIITCSGNLKTLFKLKKSYILEEKEKGSTSGGPPTA